MADLLNNCSECYQVEIPYCFSTLQIKGLDVIKDYIAVFTNHFDDKLSVTGVFNPYSGIFEIDADQFPNGYFTKFGNYTLQLFTSESNKLCGNPEQYCGENICIAITISNEAADEAVIQCCTETTLCCGEYVTVETVGDIINAYQANHYNYLIMTGTTNDEFISGADVHVDSTILAALLEVPPETLISEIIFPGEGSSLTYKFMSCNNSLADENYNENVSGCTCTSPAIVNTVGEVIEQSTGAYNYLIYVMEEHDNVVALFALLTDELLEALAIFPPDTPIPWFDAEAPDRLLFHRIISCSEPLDA